MASFWLGISKTIWEIRPFQRQKPWWMPGWEGFWCALYCCCVLFCFWRRVSLCSPGWPRTFNLPASAFQTGWPPGLPWGALDRKIKETLGNLGKRSFSQKEWLWIRTPSTNLILDCLHLNLGQWAQGAWERDWPYHVDLQCLPYPNSTPRAHRARKGRRNMHRCWPNPAWKCSEPSVRLGRASCS